MSDARLQNAYAVCRNIARREARNFYYSFLALPLPKRNALSAVYAFMRHADDLSDNQSLSSVERKRQLDAWLRDWRDAQSGSPTDNPVFIAVLDTQQRFQIPAELLEQLVAGTSMDLEHPLEEMSSPSREAGGTALASVVRVHRTFNDLYRYCYLVASVVGLVCIRIYGYKDPRAELLAERCGIAFQLTNIIRDIKEDAAMGRVYLPEEDLSRFGLTASDFLEDEGRRLEPARLQKLLEFESQRARQYYDSAAELIPMIDRDSRPALWVIVTIYRRLLEKIATRNYDVLHGRVKLSSGEKLGILARGIMKSVFKTI
ncbi:MAG: phytoene/squalene synthase family protein [Acidobacteria bacterium]|nr:phytoene/squalene synthase family protein [Acidobacteriota bacterium]